MLKSKKAVVAAMFALVFAGSLNAQDRMPSMRHGADSAAAESHGAGVVKSVDPSAGTVTIAHEPIAALNWPAMTMAFKVAEPRLLEGVVAGKHVEFMLRGKDMSAVITEIKAVD